MSKIIEYFNGSDFVAPLQPIKDMDGWKTLPIEECDEPLVPLGPFSDYSQIFTDSIYFGERNSSPYQQGELKDALLTVFVRKGVAEKLAQAAKLLPEGYALLVWDAYRPLEVQNSLYVDYVDQLKRIGGMSQEDAEEAALTFVNRASDNPASPSPHHTGGSVDLTIIKFDDKVVAKLQQLNEEISSDDWKLAYQAEMERQKLLRECSAPIDVGANFDQADEISAVTYFDDRIRNGETLTAQETEQMLHRRIFQNIMHRVGFSSFDSEWWHCDSGNQFNSAQTGQIAKYGPIKLSDENLNWEKMRLNHYKGTEILASSQQPATKTGLGSFFTRANDFLRAAVSGALKGSLRESSHPVALRLEVK